MLSALPPIALTLIAFYFLLRVSDRVLDEFTASSGLGSPSESTGPGSPAKSNPGPEGRSKRRRSRNHLKRISRANWQENNARIRLHPRQKLVVMKGRDE